VQNVAVKVAVTPLLIGGASLAGRRWGHRVGGWLVGLPLTSGPVAFFLANDQGTNFAANAAVGMLAGTISQVAFALAYRTIARSGWLAPVAAGCAAFAATTMGLSYLSWAALPTFALVIATLVAGYAWTRRPSRSMHSAIAAANPPRWDIPLRMVVATAVVLVITAVAPIIGAHLAGLLSPFPVFGVVLAVFTHHTHGSAAATAVLDGLVVGLAAPAVFFLILALSLPSLGLVAFAVAAVAALLTQGATMFTIPATSACSSQKR
jgi:hypothetical protein